MEQVTPEQEKVLAEAARLMRAGGHFEESLGKAVRHEGLDYSVYILLASMVRRRADKDRITLEHAARRLSKINQEE